MFDERRTKDLKWERPYIVFWELTRACSLSCKHCRAEAITKRNPNELTTEECFSLIEKMSEVKPLLIFTGGDPMMRDDIFEILSYAKEKNFRTAIAFSGTKKAAKKMGELKEVGIDRIAVSIDGKKEVHDEFRGVEGAYEISIEVVEAAKSLDLSFQINTTVTKETMKSLPDVAKLTLELEADMWDVFFLVPTGRAKLDQMPSPQEFEDILCWLYDLSKFINVKSSAATHFRRIEIVRKMGKMPKVSSFYFDLLRSLESMAKGRKAKEGKKVRIETLGVTDGRGIMFISHVGEVYPSGFLPIVAGNVREKDPLEIYKESKIFIELRDPEKLKGKCGLCEFKKICGGSRARAYAVFGDHLAEEPCCIHIPSKMYSTNR